ncbi:hypothetical protein [Streptomyces sp. NBC_00388]|uniref:hypothetical protein n=1 Tax=Streptomyces sp. NBC_00388 TaxID=2975735 RepID=UPI002E1C2F19
MAQAARHNPATRHNPVAALFASDGKPHPLEDALVAVTFVLGVLALIASGFNNLHLLSSWAGLVGILTGAYGMFISVTTRERFIVILGIGASAVGFYLGMAHGGLFGGVVGG